MHVRVLEGTVDYAAELKRMKLMDYAQGVAAPSGPKVIRPGGHRRRSGGAPPSPAAAGGGYDEDEQEVSILVRPPDPTIKSVLSAQFQFLIYADNCAQFSFVIHTYIHTYIYMYTYIYLNCNVMQCKGASV